MEGLPDSKRLRRTASGADRRTGFADSRRRVVRSSYSDPRKGSVLRLGPGASRPSEAASDLVLTACPSGRLWEQSAPVEAQQWPRRAVATLMPSPPLLEDPTEPASARSSW